MKKKTCKYASLFVILYEMEKKQSAFRKYIDKGGKENGIIKRMAQTCL